MMDDFRKEQRLILARQDTFGNLGSLGSCRFEKDNGKVPQLEQARRYVSNWEAMQRENMGLMLWGQPGNGKTFAAACIANALIEQEGFFVPSVRMTTFGIILNKLPGLPAQDKEAYIQSLVSCDLLILDDFGMERRTDYAREQVFNIIDGRYLSQRPLIITTNLSLEDLKHPADMVERRIYDRVREMCIPVCFQGESLRQQMAKERLALYKQLTEGQ